MATEAQLGQEAVDLAQTTSWSWDKFLNEIRTNPNYAYKNTSWYKAGGKLEQAKHLPPAPATPSLDSVRARIFLADSPLDCLQAPDWMVPVVTADHGYREWYSDDVIAQLYGRFDLVETWADCRIPSGYIEGKGTGYDEAEKMCEDFGLDGSWGQCETTPELENGWNAGARRFVGNCDVEVMPDDPWLDRLKAQEFLMTVELYRNKQPWQVPDWRGANAGIGGNTIGCYASETEGAVYTSVQTYKDQGLYVPTYDSVYGVGLAPTDWANLA